MNPAITTREVDDTLPQPIKTVPVSQLPPRIRALHQRVEQEVDWSAVYDGISAVQPQFGFRLWPRDLVTVRRVMVHELGKERARNPKARQFSAHSIRSQMCMAISTCLITRSGESSQTEVLRAPYPWLLARDLLTLERMKCAGRALRAWVDGESAVKWDTVHADHRVLVAFEDAIADTTRLLGASPAGLKRQQALEVFDRYHHRLQHLIGQGDGFQDDPKRYRVTAKVLADMEATDCIGAEASIPPAALFVNTSEACAAVELQDHAFDAATVAENRERLGAVHRAVTRSYDQLPDRQREVMRLVVLEGRTNVEAAIKLGITAGTLGRYKQAAEAALAKSLRAAESELQTARLRDSVSYAIDAGPAERILAWLAEQAHGK